MNFQATVIEKLDAILKRLGHVAHEQKALETEMAQLDTDLTALQASTAANTTAIQSATTLIGGIGTLISNAVAAALAAGATPDELKAITDVQATLDQNTAALAAAVAANTPSPPPGPVPPVQALKKP